MNPETGNSIKELGPKDERHNQPPKAGRWKGDGWQTSNNQPTKGQTVTDRRSGNGQAERHSNQPTTGELTEKIQK